MIGQVQRLAELTKLTSNAKNEEKELFVFASGKGGTGKSFLTLNLAVALSNLGKKMLVVDLDTNFSNLDVMLNISPEKTVGDYFKGSALLADIIQIVDTNLHVVFGDSGRIGMNTYTIEHFKYLLKDLRSLRDEFDYIFIDTGAGLDDAKKNLLSEADVPVIVVTPEPTAVMDAYAIIKLMKSYDYSFSPLIVINKCEEEEESVIAYNNLNSAVTHFLKSSVSFLGYIDSEKLIRKSVIEQSLFISEHSATNAADQIRKIAEKIVKMK